MKNQRLTKRYVLGAVGVLLLSAAFGLGNPSMVGASPQTPQVIVANAVNQPIPTEAQGTTAIQGSVDVTSLPAISLASGATVTVGNVVMVRPVDSAPVMPVHASGWINGPEAVVYTVPSGYRLVVEYVSGYAGFDVEIDPPTYAQFKVAGQVRQYLVLHPQGHDGGYPTVATGGPFRLYVDAGQVITIAAPAAWGLFYLEGYLVPTS